MEIMKLNETIVSHFVYRPQKEWFLIFQHQFKVKLWFQLGLESI